MNTKELKEMIFMKYEREPVSYEWVKYIRGEYDGTAKDGSEFHKETGWTDEDSKNFKWAVRDVSALDLKDAFDVPDKSETKGFDWDIESFKTKNGAYNQIILWYTMGAIGEGLDGIVKHPVLVKLKQSLKSDAQRERVDWALSELYLRILKLKRKQ